MGPRPLLKGGEWLSRLPGIFAVLTTVGCRWASRGHRFRKRPVFKPPPLFLSPSDPEFLGLGHLFRNNHNSKLPPSHPVNVNMFSPLRCFTSVGLKNGDRLCSAEKPRGNLIFQDCVSSRARKMQIDQFQWEERRENSDRREEVA